MFAHASKKAKLLLLLSAVLVILIIFAAVFAFTAKSTLYKVDGNSVFFDDIYAISFAYEDRQYSCAFPTLISEQIKDLKVGAFPISKDRSENRDSTYRIIINGRTEICIDRDFSECYILDGIKPSYSYRIKDTEKLKELFAPYLPATDASSVGDATPVTFSADLASAGPVDIIVKEETSSRSNERVLSFTVRKDRLDIWACELKSNYENWESIYLCKIDGKDVLVSYKPSIHQGYGLFGYEVFDFDEYGNAQVIESDSEIFGTSPWTSFFFAESLTKFTNELNSYLENGMLLASSFGGEFRIGSSASPIRETEKHSWIELIAPDKFDGSESVKEKLQRFYDEVIRDGEYQMPDTTFLYATARYPHEYEGKMSAELSEGALGITGSHIDILTDEISEYIEDENRIIIIYDGMLDVSVHPNKINAPYAIMAIGGVDNKTRNLVFDSIKYDIDGDGTDEFCSLVRGSDTNEQKSGRLLVREEDEIDHKYDFEIDFSQGESLYFGTDWTSNDDLIIGVYDGGCIKLHLGYFKIENGELIKY